MGMKETILEGSIYVGYWALAYFILLPIVEAMQITILEENNFLLGLFAMFFAVVMVRMFKRHNRKMGRMLSQ